MASARASNLARLSSIQAILGSRRRRKGKAAEPLLPDYGSTADSFNAEPFGEAQGGPGPGSVDSPRSDQLGEAVEGTEDESVMDTNCFRRTVRLYAIVPIVSVALFTFLVLIPYTFWKFPEMPNARTRLFGALLGGSSLWSLSHVLRVPVYRGASLFFAGYRALRRKSPHAGKLASYVKILHTVWFITLQEFLHLDDAAALSAHQPINIASFLVAWHIGLGWAIAEVGAGIAQGYEQLYVYEDLFLDQQDTELGNETGNGTLAVEGEQIDEERSFYADDTAAIEPAKPVRATYVTIETPAALDIETALARLNNARARDDLEVVYGLPFIDIPIFIGVLQRVDSFFLSLGITLVLSSAYLSSHANTPTHHLWPTFVALTTIHIFLGILHTPPLLQWIGVPAAAYVACLVSLGVLFAGIGVWGGLW